MFYWSFTRGTRNPSPRSSPHVEWPKRVYSQEPPAKWRMSTTETTPTRKLNSTTFMRNKAFSFTVRPDSLRFGSRGAAWLVTEKTLRLLEFCLAPQSRLGAACRRLYWPGGVPTGGRGPALERVWKSELPTRALDNLHAVQTVRSWRWHQEGHRLRNVAKTEEATTRAVQPLER